MRMKKIKICVAGKNDIAVDILMYLITLYSEQYEICVTYNRNETGKNSWQRSLRFFAQQNNIPSYELENLYTEKDLIFLSLEYDRIIHPEKFNSSHLFNIHFSLLPSYKGMYTSALPILYGEQYVGVTLHEIAKGIDTGRIIAQEKFALDESTSARELYLSYIKHGTNLVKQNLQNLIDNNYKCVKQTQYKSTYFSKNTIDYSNINIDLNRTAYEIGRQIKAFSFREYQMPIVNGKKIAEYEYTNIISTEKPGTIIDATSDYIQLSTIDYDIILYVDKFDEIIAMCEENRLDDLKQVTFLERYLSQRTTKGWSPLIVATYFNNKDIVYYLIKKGADITDKNINGTNLLMYAKDAYINTKDLELFQFYICKGVSPYEMDYSGHDLFYYMGTMEEKLRRGLEDIVKKVNEDKSYE